MAKIEIEDWPTTNQERQMCCVPFHTEEPEYRDICKLSIQQPFMVDVVDVYVPGVVGHFAAIDVLKRAGLTIMFDDGVRIIYQ